MAKWRWGDLHQTQFPHNPFSQVDMLKRFFHRSIETGGDNFTVDPVALQARRRLQLQWVPSYRQIMDLANWDNSRFMHTTGQSGNVLSPHYDDLIASWRQVEYVPMYWSRTTGDGVHRRWPCSRRPALVSAKPDCGAVNAANGKRMAG